MKTILKGMNLWEAVEVGEDPPPLRENPTVNEMKHHAEEVAKEYKALSFIHLAVPEAISVRIMSC